MGKSDRLDKNRGSFDDGVPPAQDDVLGIRLRVRGSLDKFGMTYLIIARHVEYSRDIPSEMKIIKTLLLIRKSFDKS